MANQTLDRIWVWMDVSATCNLACRDCYTKHAHMPKLMSEDDFRIVIQKLTAPNLQVEKLHLNWRGEPLTNKQFPALLHIKRLLLPKTPLEFHTNGMLVDLPLARELVSATTHLDQIYVSIDGGNKESHQANRGAGTWGPALGGLRALLDARDEVSDKPSVGIYEISYGRPSYDPELIRLSKRSDIFTKVSPISISGDEIHFITEGIPQGPCFWAGHSLCVTVTGDVHVCLLSFRQDGVLGNIFTDNIEDIIDRSRSFRRTLLAQGRQCVPHCRTCLKTEGDIDLY